MKMNFWASMGFDRKHFYWLCFCSATLRFFPPSTSCWFSFRLPKLHQEHPWGLDVHGQHYEVGYWPGDSKSSIFGGNSNWRGPISEFFPLKAASSLLGWTSSLLIFVHRARHQFLANWECNDSISTTATISKYIWLNIFLWCAVLIYFLTFR